MNANELADYLDNNLDANFMSEQKYIDQAATMLRHQQAEIKALKNEIMDWINDSPYNIIPDEYFKAILKKAKGDV